MTQLQRLYASGGPEILHYTLEIDDGLRKFYFVAGWSKLWAGVGANMIEFHPAAISPAEPPKNDDGSQDVAFSMSNISGEVSQYIKDCIKTGRRVQITVRKYISTNTASPAAMPETFEVKSGRWDRESITLNAGYFDLLNTAWPREVYTLNKFPGLRYL